MSNPRLYPAAPILAASVAVFRGPQVLLARRARPPLEGLFTLPGGVVELGEKLADCALRELREETGVSARILAFNRHVEVAERDDAGKVRRHFVIASFVARWLEGEGEVSDEASEILWIEPGAIGALPVTRNLAEVLAAARRLVPDD